MYLAFASYMGDKLIGEGQASAGVPVVDFGIPRMGDLVVGTDLSD